MKARPSTEPAPEGATARHAELQRWAAVLRRYQMDGIAAWLLDAGKPLALISAQMLYVSRPFLGAGISRLARLLESDDEAEAFASFLGSGMASDEAIEGNGRGKGP